MLMLLGLPVALVSLAQATSASAPPPSPPVAKPPADDCRTPPPSPESRTVIVCAQKPDGYRIDPDVLEAHREHRNQSGPRPRETMEHNDCATVGPMGCRFGPSIDLVNAAAVLAKMAATASQGGDVGKMFETTPEKSEYQLYVEAKKRREAKERAEAAAKVKAAALTPEVGPPAPPSTAPRTSPH